MNKEKPTEKEFKRFCRRIFPEIIELGSGANADYYRLWVGMVAWGDGLYRLGYSQWNMKNKHFIYPDDELYKIDFIEEDHQICISKLRERLKGLTYNVYHTIPINIGELVNEGFDRSRLSKENTTYLSTEYKGLELKLTGNIEIKVGVLHKAGDPL